LPKYLAARDGIDPVRAAGECDQVPPYPRAIGADHGGVEDERFLLNIQDDGIHLSPDQLNRVWLPYYQGERYFTGEVQGMGLGLPVVASILWECGGDCYIANRSDAPGVVVHLSFPTMSMS
jgi:nitrogen fixation/metabolism regulation signal transduction histidine kinase